jgi:ubiquinone/menaquinone biosynthesis C-methylase UbiE
MLFSMEVHGFSDTIEWYDDNAKHYAGVNSGIADLDQIEEFSKLIPKHGTVLDAGCAAGRDCQLFANKGFKVTGVDVSKGLLEIARRSVPEANFIFANFLKLPFEDESFNGVWAHQSLLHLETQEDVKDALREFWRVLKPNGTLLVLVKAQTGNSKTAIVSDSFSKHDRFFQYFSTDEVASLLSGSDFKNSRISTYREIDKNKNGRPDVNLILAISNKAMK